VHLKNDYSNLAILNEKLAEYRCGLKQSLRSKLVGDLIAKISECLEVLSNA